MGLDHARRDREQKPECDDERGVAMFVESGREKRRLTESTVGWLVLLRLRCYCPHDANPMTRIGDRARMGRRNPGTGGGCSPGDANSKTGALLDCRIKEPAQINLSRGAGATGRQFLSHRVPASFLKDLPPIG